jgi:SAM-dependent methyltransferase
MTSPYIHSENVHNTKAAREMLPTVLAAYPANSVVDFGTGLGTWLQVAKELGVEDVLGIDGDWVQPEQLAIPVEQFLAKSLHEEIRLGRRFDMAICLEVAEHLRPDAAELLVENIVRHSDIVLWSAAIEDQGGQNHINERNPDYWAGLFRAHGYVAVDAFRALFWQNENIDWWYRQNTILYVKNPAEAAAQAEAPPSPNLLIHPALFAYKMTYIQVQNKKLADIFKGRRSVGFYFRMLLKSMKNRVMDALRR